MSAILVFAALGAFAGGFFAGFWTQHRLLLTFIGFDTGARAAVFTAGDARALWRSRGLAALVLVLVAATSFALTHFIGADIWNCTVLPASIGVAIGVFKNHRINSRRLTPIH
jgi:hypothetical protein